MVPVIKMKPMRSDKKRRLERAGWRMSNTADFLGLGAQEQRMIDLKLALAAGIRRPRERRGITQAALAKQLGSSQSRVAKLEAGDHSVSLDLMIRSLISVGVGPAEIARIIRRAEAHEAAGRLDQPRISFFTNRPTSGTSRNSPGLATLTGARLAR